MTTLPIRALHLPQAWSLPSLTRVAAALLTVLDIYAEAQSEMRAAHKRYPFACE